MTPRLLRKNNKGIATVYLAIIIFMLIGFVALAVDIGYMYVAKGQLQNAADAAALAGAAALDAVIPDSATSVMNARNAAQTFAAKNKVPDGKSVDPDKGGLELDLNTGNDPNGDIILGNWDPNRAEPTPGKFIAAPADGATFIGPGGTQLVRNAVKVIARRTGDSGTGIHANPRVTLFIARAVNPNWASMTASNSAIATKNPLKTPGLALCTQTCTPPTLPLNLVLQDNAPPPGQGLAWTEFGCTQAPNVGSNGDVSKYISGEKQLNKELCDQCITTNNGIGSALGALATAFSDTRFDASNKTFNSNGTAVLSWEIAMPILDYKCNNFNPSPDCSINPACTQNPPPTPPTCNVDPASSACPPGKQGSTEERYHVNRLARVIITAVNTTGTVKGVTINGITCISCPTSPILSVKNASLVK